MGLEKAVRKKKRVKVKISNIYVLFRVELWRTKKTINEWRLLPTFVSDDLKLELYEDV